MNTIFTQRLRNSRKRKSLTQKQVASYLDVVESCYANWEQGRTEPDTSTIVKLAKIFNVSTDYLLGLTDDDVQNWNTDPIPTPIAARGAEGKTVYVTAQQQEAALAELHAAAKAEAENQKNKNQE